MYAAMIVALRSLVGLVLIGYGVAQSPFCPSPNGDFPNPASETCSAYFRCVQGRPLALRCPSEQRFDFLRLACRPRDEVDCERQLDLFATPPEFLAFLFGGQNGIGASFPFLSGQNRNQIFPNQFSSQNPQQTPQGAGVQGNANGLQGNSLLSNGLPGNGIFGNGLQGNGLQGNSVQDGAGQDAFTQGVLGAKDLFSKGVLIQGTQPVEGAPLAVGRLYPTAQGSVIVIPKQPGQQNVQIPTIQRVDTVTVSIQPSQAPVTPPQPQPAQPVAPAQPSQPAQAAQPAQPSQSAQPNQQPQS